MHTEIPEGIEPMAGRVALVSAADAGLVSRGHETIIGQGVNVHDGRTALTAVIASPEQG